MVARGVVRQVIVPIACLSMLASGCMPGAQVSEQSAARPSSAALAGHDSAPAVSVAQSNDGSQPYYNTSFHASDLDDPPNPMLQLFAKAGQGVGSALWAVVSLPVEGFKYLDGDRPGKAARMMEDASSADNRRDGINRLLEWGFAKHDPYTKRYAQIAQYDTDPTVEAVAVRALNRARDKRATGLFIKALNNSNELVRLEAAKALVNVPDVAAADPLVKTLNRPGESRDVRIAAADALKHYRTMSVARALCGVLGDREFGVSWQARRSLVYLFNRDYRYDAAAWLEYISGPSSPAK